MNKKKWLALLFIVLIVSPFLVNNAYAQSEGPLKQIISLVIANFGFLLEEKTRTEMLSGSGPGLLYLRIMLGLLILLPLYAILKVPFKSQKGIAGAIAVVVALMAVMVMPISTMIKIATTYSGFFVIIFYLVPLAAIFFLHRFIKSSAGNEGLINVAEIIIGVIGILFTAQVQSTISQMAQSYSLLGQAMDTGWFSMIYLVLGILILSAFFKMVTGKGITDKIKGKWWTGGNKGDLGNDLKGNLPGTTKGQAPLTGKEISDIEKAFGDVTNAESTIVKYMQAVNGINITELQDLSKMQAALKTLAESVSSLGPLYVAAKKYGELASSEIEKERYANMKANIDNKSSELRNHLNEVSQIFAAIETKEGEKEVLLNDEELKVQEILDRVNELENTVKKPQLMIAEKIKELNKLEGSLDDPRSAGFGSPEELQNAINDINKTLKELNALKEKMDYILPQFEQSKKDFDAIKTDIERVKQTVESFKRTFNNLTIEKVKSATQSINNNPTETEFDSSSKTILQAEEAIPNFAEQVKSNTSAALAITREVTNASARFNTVRQLLEKIEQDPLMQRT